MFSAPDKFCKAEQDCFQAHLASLKMKNLLSKWTLNPQVLSIKMMVQHEILNLYITFFVEENMVIIRYEENTHF